MQFVYNAKQAQIRRARLIRLHEARLQHPLPHGLNTLEGAQDFIDALGMLSPHQRKATQFFVSNEAIFLDLDSAVQQLEKARDGGSSAIDAATLRFLQRHLHRACNGKHSRRIIAGMVLLLALCGWVAEGEEGARLALSNGAPPEGPTISPDAMWRQFGARLLHPAEMPALFLMLRGICHRAHLQRMPDLYYLADPRSMNAYALGGPERSAITVTEGLLRGMTADEIAGILAHEVAHIRNNDVVSLSWATALHQAIALTSVAAMQKARPSGASGADRGGSIPLLLTGASIVSYLLYLTLSRIRELDADAAALELIDSPRALVAALHKLEHHHTGARLPPLAPEGLVRYLRSHPSTWERVGILIRLSH